MHFEFWYDQLRGELSESIRKLVFGLLVNSLLLWICLIQKLSKEWHLLER